MSNYNSNSFVKVDEAIDELKRARSVFGWVLLNPNHGEYIKLTKKSALEVLLSIKRHDPESEIDLSIHRDRGSVFIN